MIAKLKNLANKLNGFHQDFEALHDHYGIKEKSGKGFLSFQPGKSTKVPLIFNYIWVKSPVFQEFEMANPQKTKDQHVVPQSYLKAFMKERELYVLNLENLRKGWNEFPRKKSPGSICYVEDYYTIRGDYQDHYFGLGERDSHLVEDEVLKSLEDRYPALLENLITQSAITQAEAIKVSDFITTVNLRNPYWFEHVIKKNIREWAAKLLPELVDQRKWKIRALHGCPMRFINGSSTPCCKARMLTRTMRGNSCCSA